MQVDGNPSYRCVCESSASIVGSDCIGFACCWTRTVRVSFLVLQFLFVLSFQFIDDYTDVLHRHWVEIRRQSSANCLAALVVWWWFTRCQLLTRSTLTRPCLPKIRPRPHPILTPTLMLNSVSEKVVFAFLFLFARLIDWVMKQGVVTARLSLSKSSRALDVLNGYIENAMAQHTATSRNQIKMQANEPVKKQKKSPFDFFSFSFE